MYSQSITNNNSVSTEVVCDDFQELIMNNIYRFLFFITIFLFQLSKANSASTIVNGIVTNDYRSVVQIEVGNASCTATHLGHGIFLTAAHCINGKTSADGLKVSDYANVDFDSYYYQEPVTFQFFDIELIMHPDYLESKSIKDDLALIKIVNFKKMKISNRYAYKFISRLGFSKISLNDHPVPEEKVRMVGFGCSNSIFVADGCTGSNVKRFADHKVREVQNGEISLEGLVIDEVSGLRKNNPTASSGDSGGPLFNSKNEIIGVVSKGELDQEGYITQSFYVDLTSGSSFSFLNNNFKLKSKWQEFLDSLRKKRN
ncbi:MAG: trypsin-like serine protease [Bacteriovoracaceae bacterium]